MAAGENIFRLGLLAHIGLVAGKVLTGYFSGSTAIIADAAHSASDVVFLWRRLIFLTGITSCMFLVLSSVALLSYKVANAPKDQEHP